MAIFNVLSSIKGAEFLRSRKKEKDADAMLKASVFFVLCVAVLTLGEPSSQKTNVHSRYARDSPMGNPMGNPMEMAAGQGGNYKEIAAQIPNAGIEMAKQFVGQMEHGMGKSGSMLNK
ncbi:uncharacterized protein LOC105695399 [Orussus abietinus]|uniref:uncharacterized protein LOC105695399 n=1 Tax=Orussus abietinus TaxID=222816 RepID=UPI000625D4A1|nr:uncharacterized protein LOC105695399 [Orussus abietinus]